MAKRKMYSLVLALAATYPAAAFASTIPLGYIEWNVTSPGVAGEFDIVNQTGPNASGDSTFPVTTELQFSSLALTVRFSDGSAVNFTSSYFSPNVDGESFDGGPIAFFGSHPLPVTATLSGAVSPDSIALFGGSAATIASTFNVTFSDSPTLQDGDLAIIVTQSTPEPATWPTLAVGLVSLLAIRSRGFRRCFALLPAFIFFTYHAQAAAWTNPGDSCASLNPKGATLWDAWMQATPPDPRAKAATAVATGDWTVLAADNTIRVTPAAGAVPQDSEGPYCRTIASFGNFYLNIQYQVPAAGRVTPKGPKGVMTDQDFGNSGVYIYDRWEVQIIDPSQFDDANNKPGVANGKTIKPDPRTVKAAFQQNTLVPGSLYGADPVRADNAAIAGDALFLNQANATGKWNTLEITFCVTKADGVTPLRPPQLLTKLNGNIVYYGAVPGNGTGGRATAAAVFSGPVYLQSHWGSQVQFKDPTFDATKATCPLP